MVIPGVTMPLTTAECDFLEAFIGEYMAIENGPASRKIQERGLLASDYLHLLDAYSTANPPRLVPQEGDGPIVETLVWGQPSLNPPDPPWPDRETAQRRNAEILAERIKTS
jgi:hypothetical protein